MYVFFLKQKTPESLREFFYGFQILVISVYVKRFQVFGNAFHEASS